MRRFSRVKFLETFPIKLFIVRSDKAAFDSEWVGSSRGRESSASMVNRFVPRSQTGTKGRAELENDGAKQRAKGRGAEDTATT